jgi:hypothetical protein
MRTQASPSVSWLSIHHVCILLIPLFTGQVGKVLGERWKALNDKQRAPYEAKAAQDKKRYEDEKASYNVSADKPVGVRKRTARGTNTNVAQADAEEEESS